MKQLKQILAVVALVFCCSMTVKADTKAAQITGVKQVDDSSSSVSVSCDAALGETEYYVVELSADNQNWVIAGWGTDPNSIYVSGLTAGQTYYARVTGASDYEMDGEVRNWVASTDTSDSVEVVTAPNATTTAVQSDAATNSVSVKYSPVAGANYYVLVYNNQIIGQGVSSDLKTSVRLNAGTKYWIYAFACRRANTGYIAIGNSDYISVKTLQTKVNKTSFGVSDAWLNIDSYSFAVNSNLAADGYHFEFQTTSGKVKKNVYSVSSSVSVSNLKGTFYKYRVRSYVECGSKRVYSAWSDFKTFGIAKKVTGKYVKGNKLKLNWSKIDGASGYTIYASNKENSGYKKVKSLSANKRNITISKIRGKKLKKNKPYYVRIVPKAKKLGNADTYGYYSYRLRSY